MNRILVRAGASLCGTVLLTACGSSNSGQPAARGAAPAIAMESSAQPPAVATILHSEALAAAQPTTACALDHVDARAPHASIFTVAADHISTFRGWAVDATNAAPPGATLILEGSQNWGLSTLTGQDRPDVAKAVGSPAAQMAGFLFKATLAQVPAGTYNALLWIDTSTGNTVCDTGKQIVVKR